MAKKLDFQITADAKQGIAGLTRFKTAGMGAASGVAASFAKAGPLIGAAVVAMGLVGMVKVLKSSVDAARGFEKSMANVSTLVDTSVVSMSALKDEIMKLPSYLIGATEAADALYQAISAGVKAEDSVAFVGEAAKSAKAGLTDAFTAVDALTTMINAYGLKSKDVTAVSDKMFVAVKAGKTTFEELAKSIGRVAPVAANAGVGMGELLASIATVTKSGVKTAEAMSAIKAALSNIAKPNKDARDLAGELGIQFDATALQAKGLAKFIKEIETATGGSFDMMTKFFGSVEAVNAMVILAGKGAKDYAEVNEAMANSIGETQVAFEKQLSTMDASMIAMGNAWEKVKIIIGDNLLPIIAEVANKIALWVDANQELIKQEVGKVFEDIVPLMRDLITGIEELAPSLKILWDVFAGGIKILASTISGLAKAGKAVVEVHNKINDTLLDMLHLQEKMTLKQFDKSLVRHEKTNKVLKKQLSTWKQLNTEYKILFGTQKQFKDWATEFVGVEKAASMSRKEIQKLIREISGEKRIKINFVGEGSSVKPLGEKIDEMNRKLFKFADDVEESKPKVKVSFEDQNGRHITDALNTVKGDFTNFFSSIVEGTATVEDAFRNMAKDILKTVYRMMINKAVGQFIAMVGGMFAGGISGGGSTIHGGGGGGYGLAAGGPATAGKPYLIGEKGPEMFIPNRSGTVVPNGGFGGGFSQTNNISIQQSQPGSEEENKALSSQIARAIEEKTKAIIANQMRPRGLLNPV